MPRWKPNAMPERLSPACSRPTVRALWRLRAPVLPEPHRTSSLEKVACGAFCAYLSLDGTLWVDLRSTKRAPARLSDISFVSAGKKRGFCQLRSSRGKRKSDGLPADAGAGG